MKLILVIIYFLLINFSFAGDEVKQLNLFKHNPGRLFSIQTADVQNSLDLSLLIGGSFGLESKESFLGSVAFGLGGYGDVEVSTASLLGSILSKTENFASIGLKVKVIGENENIPGISVLLKTNNDWYSSLNEDIKNKKPELAEYGLIQVSYDARITHLIISMSKSLEENFRLHVNYGIGDLRYKNLRSYFRDTVVIDENEKQKNTFYGAFGFDYKLSEITTLIFEGQTIPYLKVDPKTGKITPALRKVFSSGLRVNATKWLLFDSGFRYQDDYKGLADIEIKISLQAFINIISREP